MWLELAASGIQKYPEEGLWLVKVEPAASEDRFGPRY
jgi:hypothetical protein